jgi:hypothetical protein
MRIRLAAAAVLLLTACTDDHPLSSRPDPQGAAPRANTYSQPGHWRGHWQGPNELWVYDKSPELGMNAHMFDVPLQTHYMRMVKGAGMRIVRDALYWSEMDPDGDRIYDQAKVQAFRHRVDSAQALGLEIMPSVHGMWTNGDAAQRGDPLPWDGATSLADFNQRFAYFLQDMVVMFPTVKLWQVWNEQDTPGWAYPYRRFSGPNPADWGRGYARTLKAVYPYIKSQPGKWVVMGGLAESEVNFVRAMYQELEALGGKPYPFDIMAMHGYDVSPYSGVGPFANVHNLTAVMAEFGDQNRPIWLTETGTSGEWYERVYGWPGGDAGQAFDESQRAYYDALANGLYGSPISKALGYNVFTLAGDPSHGTADGRPASDFNLSLVRSDMTTPRPAWNWLYDRRFTTSAAWNRPADVGDFRITTFASIPSQHPFIYLDDGSLAIKGLSVNTLTPTSVPFVTPLQYQPHIGGIGPLYTVYNNQVAGYATEERYMDRLRIQPMGLPLVACYQVHQSGYGDQPVVCSDFADPWTGVGGYRLEALRVVLNANPDWSICYQVYAWGHGWSPWACDGDWAGSRGLARGFGAMRIRIHRK